MPMFRFLCPHCQNIQLRLSKASQSEIGCEVEGCDGIAVKQLPLELSTQTLEMRDSHRGVQLPKNQERKIKERMTNHHDKYDVAEKIDKYGMDEAKRNGWLKKGKDK